MLKLFIAILLLPTFTYSKAPDCINRFYRQVTLANYYESIRPQIQSDKSLSLEEVAKELSSEYQRILISHYPSSIQNDLRKSLSNYKVTSQKWLHKIRQHNKKKSEEMASNPFGVYEADEDESFLEVESYDNTITLNREFFDNVIASSLNKFSEIQRIAHKKIQGDYGPSDFVNPLPITALKWHSGRRLELHREWEYLNIFPDNVFDMMYEKLSSDLLILLKNTQEDEVKDEISKMFEETFQKLKNARKLSQKEYLNLYLGSERTRNLIISGIIVDYGIKIGSTLLVAAFIFSDGEPRKIDP